MWSLEALKFHVKLQHFKQGAWHSYFESQKFLVELWSLSHRLEKKRGVSVTEERLPGPVCGVQILYRIEIEGQDSDDPHLAAGDGASSTTRVSYLKGTDISLA